MTGCGEGRRRVVDWVPGPHRFRRSALGPVVSNTPGDENRPSLGGSLSLCSSLSSGKCAKGQELTARSVNNQADKLATKLPRAVTTQ